MRLYRVFSNDRSQPRGVPLYSCLMETHGETPGDAVAQASPTYGTPKHASMVAIEWPPETLESKAWLAKHVDVDD
jgi:hypothetical protein